MKPHRERYELVLEEMPDPDGVPAIHRLRALLKRALRNHRLRCVSARTLPDTSAVQDQPITIEVDDEQRA